jgi:hypothetical protein
MTNCEGCDTMLQFVRGNTKETTKNIRLVRWFTVRDQYQEPEHELGALPVMLA